MTFRLRPGKKGLELRLHDLEAAIMDLVWSRKWSDVSRWARCSRSWSESGTIAYTTVMTTVARLHDKGTLGSKALTAKRYL